MIKFYGANKENGFMSNFYICNVMIDGCVWLTTEHYYQAQKTLDLEMREIIRFAETPHLAAQYGRYKIKLRDDWDSIKAAVMYKAVYEKFTQSMYLRIQLLATEKEELVENTVGSVRPDAVWGNGKNGEGLNLLGKILMMVRAEL